MAVSSSAARQAVSFEGAVASLSNLPTKLVSDLNRIRSLDKETHAETIDIIQKEKAMFEKLKQASNDGPDFDEEPLKAEFYALLERRQSLLSKLDTQVDASKQIYCVLDQALKYFDSITAGTNSMFPSYLKVPAVEGPVKKKKKKTKTYSTLGDEDGSLEFLLAEEALVSEAQRNARPEDPVFCVCKRVSAGQMICCEPSVEGCPFYEWYHFCCVGLTKEPEGDWICPECVNQLIMAKDASTKQDPTVTVTSNNKVTDNHT